MFDWLITHDMAFLSPQSTMSHNISLSSNQNLYMPNIWKREKLFMALDNKSDDTQFGSRTYMLLDQEKIEKGIGIK